MIDLAKIEIVQNEDNTGYVAIDGVKMKGVQELVLRWKAGELPCIDVSFIPDSLKCDICIGVAKISPPENVTEGDKD